VRLPWAARTLSGVLLCWAVTGVSASRAEQRPRDLTQISLEELMNIEVISVSKKEQRLSQVAAAVYVITQEDIRRSGATSIAEALRMAPGLQVARVDEKAQMRTELERAEGESRHHQAYIESYLDLPRRPSLDVAAYCVSSLAAASPGR
jgi:outer membrane receptor for monomeric catechols